MKMLNEITLTGVVILTLTVAVVCISTIKPDDRLINCYNKQRDIYAMQWAKACAREGNPDGACQLAQIDRQYVNWDSFMQQAKVCERIK